MPKFTEQEKEQVRQSLLIKGRELFIQYGLAKTSIDDVILACGIGKGTFYKFFASKEELYFEILKNEEEVRETVLFEKICLQRNCWLLFSAPHLNWSRRTPFFNAFFKMMNMSGLPASFLSK